MTKLYQVESLERLLSDPRDFTAGQPVFVQGGFPKLALFDLDNSLVALVPGFTTTWKTTLSKGEVIVGETTIVSTGDGKAYVFPVATTISIEQTESKPGMLSFDKAVIRWAADPQVLHNHTLKVSTPIKEVA